MEKVQEILDANAEANPRAPPRLPPDMHHILETDQWKIMEAIMQNTKTAFFSNQAIKHARSKAFFTTKEGYIGTASTTIEVGDRLALVSGVAVPLVLRKAEGGPDWYTLVCPAFVHGVMFGEKWPEVEDDADPRQ